MSQARQAYHHGNLAVALVEAGLELTRTGGPAALVLRDVTRRVGVSPNAAYRHFADLDRLRDAVALRIQRDMAARMLAYEQSGSRELSPPRRARNALRAVGLGYIEFALSEPGWFELAFATTRVPVGDELPPPPPFALLVDALDQLVRTGRLNPDLRPGAEWPCWSAVHGFALLALNGPLRGQPRAVVGPAAERTVDTIIDGLLRPGGGGAGSTGE